MRRTMPARNHGGGPLRTDHLELHELDLELELLKRKREMIEKQQQMMSGPSHSYGRPRPFDYDNNQPQPLFPGLQQYSSPGNGYGGLLGKRPMNDQPWQSYYSGPQGGAKRKFNSGPGPKPNQPKPAYSGGSRSYPQSRFTTPKPHKPVYASKVSKPRPAPPKPAPLKQAPPKQGPPKQAPPNNKQNSQPTQERPKAAKKTPQSTKPEDVDSFILREDRVPSQQLAGRLELALGNILKEIKTKCCNSEQNAVNFSSMFLQRHMKQAIRERLRSVMMGQYVGKVDTIIEQYRKVFPVDTDSEIVQSALDAHECTEAMQLAIKLEHAGNAYAYIKHNLNRLIGVTLDDMFTKVQKLYEDEKENTKDICHKILEEKIPDAYNKNASLNDTKDSENAEGKDESKEAEKIENDDSKNETAAVDQPKEDGENKQNNDSTTQNTSHREKETVVKLDYLILSLLRRRLPFILPRYKSMIMKIINIGGPQQFKKTIEVEKKVVGNNSAEITERKPPAAYRVKIFGKPHLPTRKIMQTFLNEFKPSSVKKHKTMPLLFVSFRSKDDHDKIVAVKESTLGDCTITIRTGDRAANPDSSLNTTAASLNESTDDSVKLTSELDEQINDLLHSIRKDEENKADGDTSSQANGAEDSNKTTDGEEVAPEQTPAVNATQGDAEVNAPTQENDEMNAASEENAEANQQNAEKDGTNGDVQADAKVESEEAKDRVEELKNEAKETGRSTPTRSSSRIANVTPSSIRTRRASRLANN